MAKNKDFVHLHVHSVYSRDSIIRITDLCERVSGLGMSAVAVTDHGGLMGAVEFHDAAKKVGIKSIFGCEVLVSTGSLPGMEGYPPDEEWHHLVLLAENDEGYRNLMRLVSVPRRGEFPGELVVDKALLRRYGKGLIATSACNKGEIPYLLNTSGERSATQALEGYREIFAGRFYLEIQDTGISWQPQLNEKILRLSNRTDTPLVATNNCRHLDLNDSRELEILQSLRAGVSLSGWKDFAFPLRSNHIRSAREMEKVFGHISIESLVNTLEIAERCNVTMKTEKVTYPLYECPDEIPPDAYLRQLAYDGLSIRFMEMYLGGEVIESGEEELYRKRLDHELEVVRERSAASVYFLVVWDYTRYARKQSISVGPGRGSAPGSLFAYVLRLTDIDPLRYGLHFERFLNPLRNLPPDIDSDFCSERRDELFGYLGEKYGSAYVSRISTFGVLKGRRAIKDVGRVLELHEADVEEVAGMIPKKHDTIENGMEYEPLLRKVAEGNPELGELVFRAASLEGVVMTVGRNVAAVAISDRPVSEKVPVFDTKDGLVTQFSLGGLEKAGIVTHHLLGFRVLTVIQEAVRRIRERFGTQVDVENIPLDDAPTFEMLCRGDVSGVFQCDWDGFVDLIDKLQPERFSHLVDAIALYRPQPIRNGTKDEYFDRRNGRPGKIRVVIPAIEEIIGDTYGVILYQEQIMDLAVRLAGSSMEEADLFRVAVCKGNSGRERTSFIEGGIRTGHPKRRMERVFGQIEREGNYSFCKAHAVGYGLILYRTAFLKCHWPQEYSAAVEIFGMGTKNPG